MRIVSENGLEISDEEDYNIEYKTDFEGGDL